MADKRSEFSAFRLKKESVRFLQDLKRAFELSYGKEMSNDEFIQQMGASEETGDPAVWEIYGQMQEAQQKLEELAAQARKKREQEQ